LNRNLTRIPSYIDPLGSLAFVIVVLLWESLSTWGLIDVKFFSSPSAIGSTLYLLLASGKLWPHVYTTLYRSLLAFTLAGVLGILVGLLMALYRQIDRQLSVVFGVFYPLPKVALVPILMLWLGLGDAPVITVGAISALYPVLLNMIAGVRRIDATLVRAAMDLGANYSQIVVKVIIPASTPAILAGLKLAIAQSFITVVASEMISFAPGGVGLGWLVTSRGYEGDVSTVFAGLVSLAIVGGSLLLLADRFEKKLLRWRREER